jgi:carbohydrate diacid regulator
MINENISKLINTLYESTGIHFAVDESRPYEENDETDERLNNIIVKLGKKISKASIFEKYLTGELSSEEAKKMMDASHFGREEKYDMYYLNFNTDYDNSVFSILRNMTSTASWELLKMSSRAIVMLNPVKEATDPSESKHFAYSIHDMLSTEAMISVRISYDKTSENFLELPKIYQNLATAMLVGSTFNVERHVYGYHELGLGKLIYSLPREAAEGFLKDALPNVDFEELDNETINTINTFFECGLNISETGRVLYLHRNTLVYRLDKFSRNTGLDIRNFDDAVKCRIGMMISTYLRNQPLQNENSEI